MGVVLAQPHRLGERSHHAECVLGRLLLTKQVNQDQFSAGERYATVVTRYDRDVLGISHRYPAGSMAERVGGRDVTPDPSPEAIDDLKRRHADIMEVLANNGLYVSGVRALARICLMNVEPTTWEDLGNARSALNVLHRLFSVEPRGRG